MAAVVYILCAVLSLACSILLYRGFQKNNFRMLFWSSLGFLGFALNNVLLFVDMITGPELDLSIVRTLPALLGMVVLIYGLIQEST
jgi:drug/metabolite transporter (DMT)-like permease